jgi:hypothetical protein
VGVQGREGKEGWKEKRKERKEIAKLYIVSTQHPLLVVWLVTISVTVVSQRVRNTVRYFERDHIHVSFFTVYCYNCSSLLLVVNFLLSLI